MHEHSTVPEYLKLSELKKELDATGHHITTRNLRYLCQKGEIEALRVGRLLLVCREEAERVKATRGSRPPRERVDGPRNEAWTEKDARRVIARRYDLPANEYEAMCNAVGNRCTICGCDPEAKYAHKHAKARRLQVDHDHQTGKVRGLLCGPCNNRLAWAGDNPTILRALLDYTEGRLTPATQLAFFDKSA